MNALRASTTSATHRCFIFAPLLTKKVLEKSPCELVVQMFACGQPTVRLAECQARSRQHRDADAIIRYPSKPDLPAPLASRRHSLTVAELEKRNQVLP